MFLMIRNPGVADKLAITLIGASSSRDCGRDGTIGMFGSGAKNSFALLYRKGMCPITITTGTDRMEISARSQIVAGKVMNIMTIKHGKKKAVDMQYTDGMGELDWRDVDMALREFVANGLDGCLASGHDYSALEIEVVSDIRAKSGHTAVFIPYHPEIREAHHKLPGTFLHLSDPDSLDRKIIPRKLSDRTHVYKNGVLAAIWQGPGIYDYNLGDELRLDESRNASEETVKAAVGRALRDAKAGELATILKVVSKDDSLFESHLAWYNLSTDEYSYDYKTKFPQRAKEWQMAWFMAFGPNTILSEGNANVMSFVINKGFTPVPVKSRCWSKALTSYGIRQESDVLGCDEMEGKEVGPPTKDHLDSLEKVWNLFTSFGLAHKPKPGVASFTSVMDGGAMTYGYYKPGDDKVHIHKDLSAGLSLDKCMLEEVTHYVTGSSDGSRDLQDYLFRLVTSIAF